MGELSTPMSLNRYTYGFASPLNYWDPDGRFSIRSNSILVEAAQTAQASMGSFGSQRQMDHFLDINTNLGPANTKPPTSSTKKSPTTSSTAGAEARLVSEQRETATTESRGGILDGLVGGYFTTATFFGDLLAGAQTAVDDTVEGITQTGGLAYRSSTLNAVIDRDSYVEQWKANVQLGYQIVSDPWGTIVQPTVDEVTRAWKEGRPGEAIGYGTVIGADLFFGAKAAKSLKTIDLAPTSIADDIVRLSDDYIDITKRSRVRNVQTNVSRSSFEQGLLDSGFDRTVLTTDGTVVRYELDGVRYVVRDAAESTGGSTADFYPAGSVDFTLKIRLGG